MNIFTPFFDHKSHSSDQFQYSVSDQTTSKDEFNEFNNFKTNSRDITDQYLDFNNNNNKLQSYSDLEQAEIKDNFLMQITPPVFSKMEVEEEIQTKPKKPRKKREVYSKEDRKIIKGMVIALNNGEETINTIRNTVSQMGYKITRSHITKVIDKFQLSKNILAEYGACGRDKILKDKDIKRIISRIYHNDVSLKEAAFGAHVSRHTLSRYLAGFGLGVTQYNSKKKISMVVNYDKIEIKNENDYLLQTNKPSIIVYVRIMFPKIQFGQVHQWDRFYEKFYKEVPIFNMKWLGYYKGNKMNGRGCFIIIKSLLEQPNIFKTINQLENYLRKFIPESNFSSNVMPTNKLRVYMTFEEAETVIDNSYPFKTFDTLEIRKRVRKSKPYTQQESEFIKNFKKDGINCSNFIGNQFNDDDDVNHN